MQNMLCCSLFWEKLRWCFCITFPLSKILKRVWFFWVLKPLPTSMKRKRFVGQCSFVTPHLIHSDIWWQILPLSRNCSSCDVDNAQDQFVIQIRFQLMVSPTTKVGYPTRQLSKNIQHILPAKSWRIPQSFHIFLSISTC